MSSGGCQTKQNLLSGERDPVHVFCRLRQNTCEDVSCVKIISPTSILLTPPPSALNYRNEDLKAMKYTFKEAFPPETSQQDVFDKVALPLVEGLVKGKNGLLFTYGITASGKTFTMTGEPNNCGILPRALNIIFKTINDYQAPKYVFKPDKMNMFDIQSEAEAMLEHQQELNKFKTGKKNKSNPDLAMSATDASYIGGLNEDNQYAVYVTYVEIYNNSIFDLLEDVPPISKKLPVKMLKEDLARKVYVHGVTEIEVKSAEEAFDAFYLGLKRKRMADTILNANSSRSHSVFTIRLVQAPVDEMGESVIPNKKLLSISQLSLVDLAGSERTNRTKNTGQRLRETGNINKSLMTLRTCLEMLRENQVNSANNMVPYRESKITHLFKNFFEGEGQVRMIVCVNPRADDYNENLKVVRFAEMAAEVEVTRPQFHNLASEMGLIDGRRKANRLFHTAQENMAQPKARDIELDLGIVYSLGPDLPNLDLKSPQAQHIIKELMSCLEMQINQREMLKKSKAIKDEKLRSDILEIEKESLALSRENSSLKRQIAALEERLMASENASQSYQRKLTEITQYVTDLKRELQKKDFLLSQKNLEKEKQKKNLERKYNHVIAAEHEKAKEIYSEAEVLRTANEEKENKLHSLLSFLQLIAQALGTDQGDNEVPQLVVTGDMAAQAIEKNFTTGSTPKALPAHLLTPFSQHTQTSTNDSCARHLSKRKKTVHSPPQSPSNASKKRRIEDA